jgi:diamine N-acetyltransferase
MENQYSTSRDKVTVRPLTRFNWEEATQLRLYDYQEDYLPGVLHTIAQSKYENVFPHGIFLGDRMVGFIAYGEFSGVCWVSRVLVDRDFQNQGVGRDALAILLERLRKDPKCREIRTSFAKQNALAEYFFGSMGFERLGDGLDDEIIMRLR